jgi:hypothetical protein
MTCDYTLQITITHILVFSNTVFTALLGSSFHQRMSPSSLFPNCPQPQLPASHYSQLNSQLIMAAGPCYISLAQTAQKTQIQTVFYCCVLVCSGHHVMAIEPLPRNGRLQNRSLATAVSGGFTVLAFSRHTTIY